MADEVAVPVPGATEDPIVFENEVIGHPGSTASGAVNCSSGFRTTSMEHFQGLLLLAPQSPSETVQFGKVRTQTLEMLRRFCSGFCLTEATSSRDADAKTSSFGRAMESPKPDSATRGNASGRTGLRAPSCSSLPSSPQPALSPLRLSVSILRSPFFLRLHVCACVRACVRMCVCASVRACMRACVRACVRACLCLAVRTCA